MCEVFENISTKRKNMAEYLKCNQNKGGAKWPHLCFDYRHHEAEMRVMVL